jgi:hypothetical protein
MWLNQRRRHLPLREKVTTSPSPFLTSPVSAMPFAAKYKNRASKWSSDQGPDFKTFSAQKTKASNQPAKQCITYLVTAAHLHPMLTSAKHAENSKLE